MESGAVKGDGVRRLMANAIKNFHFFEDFPFCVIINLDIEKW